MRCQVCNKWSTFNVVSTIIKPDETGEPSNGKLSEGS
jgi:hypothetical protein